MSIETVIEGILQETERLGFNMPSEPVAGQLLRALAASKPGGRMVELGTGTGLSMAWLLDGMNDDASLISVDTDADVQNVARKFFGEDSRVSFVCQDGADFVLEAKPQSYDLIFADAWPGKYSHLDETLALLKPGGLYVVDDLLPQNNWPEGHQANVDAFLIYMKKRSDVCVSFLEAGSGLLIATKR